VATYCIATEIDDENFVEIQPVDPSGQRRKKKGESMSWGGFEDSGKCSVCTHVKMPMCASTVQVIIGMSATIDITTQPKRLHSETT
jgi:hypothetical protein